MVWVELPARNKGISGTLPTILAAGATYRQDVGKGSYNFVTPARSIGQLLGSFSSSKVQVVTEVIRAASVGCILWGSPTHWTQVAGKEKLQTSIPTVFQRNIFVNLLNE
jgi:hypothetical protein